MNDTQEARLAELEAKKADNSITPEEEAARVAYLELDEKDEALEAAKAAAVPPTPDPVAEAQAAVDTAQQAVDAAEAAITPAV